MNITAGTRFERGQQIFYVLEVGHEFKVVSGIVHSSHRRVSQSVPGIRLET